MKDASTKFGCLFPTGHGKEFNKLTKKMEDVTYFCKKIQAEDSEFCPKHVLIVQDQKEMPKRRAAKAVETKRFKKDKLQALESSPLAAVNPNFDKARDYGYSR